VSSNDAKNILCLVTGSLLFALLVLPLVRYCKKPDWIIKRIDGVDSKQIVRKIVRKIEWLRTFYAWIGALAISRRNLGVLPSYSYQLRLQ
jgi:hypothetical protein